MSGVTGAGSIPFSISGQSYGPLSQIVENASLTSQELDKLTEQASSGLISQSYSGLGASAANTVLTISPQISAANAQITAISAATGPMALQQNAFSEISSLVTGISAQLGTMTESSGQASTVISSAQAALQEVVASLDTQNGDSYVFGGQDSGELPVPNPNTFTSSGFYTQIQSAVSGLTSNGASATFASILSIAGSTSGGTSPFAAGLEASTGLPTVTLGNGEQVTTGIAANANGFVTSSGTGTTSTGSYMRDILGGLSAIASLSPSQASGSTFESFIDTVQSSLNNADTALNDDAGVLGNVQSELTAQATSLGNTVTALTNQVSGADSVDVASTLTQLSSTQTALQSSYQIIATMKTLNLAYYL